MVDVRRQVFSERSFRPDLYTDSQFRAFTSGNGGFVESQAESIAVMDYGASDPDRIPRY